MQCGVEERQEECREGEHKRKVFTEENEDVVNRRKVEGEVKGITRNGRGECDGRKRSSKITRKRIPVNKNHATKKRARVDFEEQKDRQRGSAGGVHDNYFCSGF